MYAYLTTSYDKEDNPDFIADFTLFITWSEIEVNVGMIVCCMPVLAPVVRRFAGSLAEYLQQCMHLSTSSSSDDDRGEEEQSIPLSPRRKAGGTAYPYPCSSTQSSAYTDRMDGARMSGEVW
jgi:hypothetical protein